MQFLFIFLASISVTVQIKLGVNEAVDVTLKVIPFKVLASFSFGSFRT